MIDWNRIAELKEEVGEEVFPEVVALFLEEFEGALGTLSPAAPTTAEMHFLKGSAATLGFAQTGELCGKAETQLKTEGRCHVQVAEIISAYFGEKTELLAQTS